MTNPATLEDSLDFSLVQGGPLYQLFQKTHLSGPTLELLRRRILFFSLITWVPLAVLSATGGQLWSRDHLGFLRDLETHVRFLVALPVLILAELIVHQRIRPLAKRFVERGVIASEDRPRFHAAIGTALRLRNSVIIEIGLLIFVYTAGHWIWGHEIVAIGNTWYAVPDANGFHFTLAGYWNAFVSVPIFQFILLRWYLRILIWFWFLWRVSRLSLHLLPAHPDRTGGIGFLAGSSYAFSPLLFAQGSLLSGLIASRVLYEGQSLLSFKMQIGTLVGFFVLVILGPLAMFSPQLSRAKRSGLAEYGNLASNYVREFDEKWLHGDAKGEEVLGTADIQSLADLGNSYAVVREMRSVPFGLDDITRLVVATSAPLLPLLLTIMPLDELVMRILKIVF
jgi:uncharacterized membrane protein